MFAKVRVKYFYFIVIGLQYASTPFGKAYFENIMNNLFVHIIKYIVCVSSEKKYLIVNSIKRVNLAITENIRLYLTISHTLLPISKINVVISNFIFSSYTLPRRKIHEAISYDKNS